MGMQFTRTDDGCVTVDKFLDEDCASMSLLASADPDVFLVDWIGVRVRILGVGYVVVAADYANQTVNLRRVVSG